MILPQHLWEKGWGRIDKRGEHPRTLIGCRIFKEVM